jgi:hypothetical protein
MERLFRIAFLFSIATSSAASGAPARLGGFRWRTDDLGRIEPGPGTEEFNTPDVPEEDPVPPPYLDENGNDARTRLPPGEDKYVLTPVYSAQQLYDISQGALSREDLRGGGEDERDEYGEDEEEFEEYE